MSDDNTVHNKALGSRIHWMRQTHGLTQEDLGTKAGLAADTIRRAERGEFAPLFTTLRKIAAGLGVPLVALFSDTYDQADDLAAQSADTDSRRRKPAPGVTVVRATLRAGA